MLSHGNLFCLLLIVKAKITVTIALAADANNAVKNTPFSPHTGVNITKNDKGKRLITVGRSLKNKLYWDTINYMENDNKNAETVNHIKGLQSFIFSIEKNGYEKCYSKPMIENVRKYGFRTLKDLIDSL